MALLQPGCDHKGWLLWLTYYSTYCAGCGRSETVPSLIPFLGAHRKGEWVVGFYNPNELIKEDPEVNGKDE